MENLRKYHNDLKRSFIIKNVKQGSKVLDVGSGRGGDLQKWRSVGARLTMCEPDEESLIEARNRALTVFPECLFFKGDILRVPVDQYDYVCYNFSLQYIFTEESYARVCIQTVSNLLRPGGKFIGVVPDAQKIMEKPQDWKDDLGNSIRRGWSIGKNEPKFGEMIIVNFGDGPYYSQGAIPEPLCYKTLLVQLCMEARMILIKWEPFAKEKNGRITDVYSQFIFERL